MLFLKVDECPQNDFGISVPPLVDYLKTILREYSDGQIIKELVQNAEDAGADTVKFLYDVRHHGTETLYRDSLAPYQGPALYSFNNAKFKKADWDGIQTPARSKKKTDRLKVGRFGIGFNSVYHITDLPSIMSDQKLAFIDPLEEHFFDKRGRVKTGWQFGLGFDSDIFSNNEDQFQPYHNIFPGVTGGISTGYFDGTLFRFPLRHTANSLSDKIYSDEGTLSELLLAFRADADVAILFLRSLNNIEVLKRPSGLQEPSLVVRVRREHDPETHPPGKEFSLRLESYCSDVSGRRGPIKLIDCVTFTTETPEASKAQRWVVSHHIAGDSMSRELSDLAEKQSYLPWAAVAIPVSSSEPSNVAGEAEDNNIGRVFCFLPLPPGEESQTGLPVHVHGFFAVNSDRRGIKWPGPDQTDTPAQWNQLLVRELIPIVYVDAIKYAISIHTSQDKVTTDCIYRSWPDHKEVRGNWDILLEPFYNALFQETIIHSDNNGWMNIADVHFNELNVDEDMEKAILKCFNIKGIAYARVLNVCRQAIRKFYKDQISTVSASSLCRCLREDPAILTKLNADEKLLILEFILREDARQDLEGLCLLPLDDGSVHVFSSSDEKKVYIPTTKFHRQLILGGNHQFIRTVPEDKPLHELLSNMDGRYQLNALTLDAVAELLKTSMKTRIDDQGTWVQDTDGPSLNTWLEKVWSMLYRESSSKLLLFEGIHLVPLFEADDEGRRLLPLCPKSGIIQRSHQSLTLTNDLANILQQLGVTVTNCPDYVLRHPAIMRDEYIKMPTSEGVVKCLLLSDVELLVQIFHSFSTIDRDVLVEYLAQAKLSHDGKKLLSCLPLFERVDGTGSSNKPLVTIEQCEGYIDCCQDDIPAPLKLTGLLIDGRTKSKCLLQKLEVCLLSKYQVIMKILEEIQKGLLYTKQEKQLVLQWIMEHWEDIKINCKSSVGILRHMKFIPNKNNSLLSPCELLDPSDPLLDELFASQGVFPMAPFDSPQFIVAFKQFGMREPSEVTSSELITCVEMVDESQNPEKARTLLELLTSNQSLLERSVIDRMKQKQCIPCRQSHPEYYPSAIEWYGKRSTRLSTPREILREKKLDVLICGASRCFTSQEDESRFSSVYTKIGMNIPSPIISDVMTQLDHCVRYAEDRTGEDVTDIVPMLKEIYSFLMESWRQDKNIKNLILNRAKVCIWNGSGFSEPSKMCVVEPPFHLAPYMASIPPSTIAFADLFEALGVEKNMAANSNALVDILHEIKKRCDDSENDVAFQQGQRQLVLQILHHLRAEEELSEEAVLRLLVPSRKGECRLIPVDESAYVDRDWLRQSTDNEEMDDDEDFTLIHSDISMDLAIFLHVRPVSRLLLDSEELPVFTQAGQHEPLTTRLWNILKNNYVDTAIVSEMIQNAEDAGAQEVGFLIDMRNNENANQKLFDPEMKSCQGPALWVYNDAVFSDQDFENILRLGGRTKEKDAKKIGKFGTGFNSVYRITDVPSFVSRDYMQFFDPHTTHLGSVLPNKSQPGVRLRLNSSKPLRRFPDQFKPFKGVFGLNFSGGNEPFNYDGTLFRLPLRSKEAAQKSQICKESYDGEKLINLMQKMWESSQNLLVFTKKVKKVALFYLSENSSDPSRAEELLTIQKTMRSPRMKDDTTVVSTESIHCTMTAKGNEMMSQKPKVSEDLDIVKVICKTSEQAASLAKSPDGKECGLSPEGAVAFPFHRPPMSEFEKQMYCFLSLSIPSLFPVHINGSFAVKEDRRSLHMPVPDGRLISEKWNHILLTDVICRAYVALLSDSEFIQQVKDTYGTDMSHEELWPDIDDVPNNSECSVLFDAFYKAIVHGFDGREPSLFWKDGKSHQFTNVVFLSEEVQKETSVSDVVTKVLRDHLPSMEVMSLTKKTWRALKRVQVIDEVLKRTYDFNRFFNEVFLPHISQMPDSIRNQLVLFALNNSEDTLQQKLKDVKCIPVEGGTELRKPCDLVHPKGKAAPLFSESDKVFPLREKFTDINTLASLTKLGMMKDYLHEDIFVERCETVHILHSSCMEVAQARCHAVLKYLAEMLGSDWNEKTLLKERLSSIPFLPIMCNENRDPALPWVETDCAYASANDVYSHSKRYLVSSTSNVVDESGVWKLPRKVEHCLGLADKYPSVQGVLKQFSNFRSHYEMNKESISDNRLQMISEAVYERVEIACKENSPDISNEDLQNQSFFLVDRKFVVASVVADGGRDLPPYLFKASQFLKQYPILLERAALKREFDAGDYQGVLQSIHEDSSGEPLDDEVLEVAILAADRLASFLKDDDGRRPLDAFLPDEDKCMRPISDLCYTDVDWFEYDEIELHKCHMKISFMLAKKLKVKDVRQQMLQLYDIDFPGEEFGQHEKLTTRIKRILDSYPSDETILKELLQNADDAGATEIHFVYDPRSHNGNKLLGDSMKALQGPALCVFNNQSFTDEDIRGIQNLGEGSKADHMGKIGRYGVGFNAVYQLTDCPSFISKGERLCMFDPLQKYIPGATSTKPGRQIRVNGSVRSSYPDIFQCYLEDILADGEQDYTVFRFPLREKASTLSKNVWRPGEIRKLLQDFENAAFESLLFLKNITKISISELTSSGVIGSTHAITAEITEVEGEKKMDFLRKVQDISRAAKDDSTWQPEPAEVIYQMRLKGKGRDEDWVICQQVGSADTAEENIMRKRKLLPVGAVAARLTGKKEELKGTAFCFLPLPIATGLPVHVHGYFALDHESRRHLWEGSKTDEQTKWNFHLIQKVIAPAYVKLLLWIQGFFVRKYEWSGSKSCQQKAHTLKLLQKYHTFFPNIGEKGSYWKTLEATVYEIVASEALMLLPSLYRKDDDNNDFFLTWKTPVVHMQPPDESKVGYFNTLPNQMSDHFTFPTSSSSKAEMQENVKKLKETLIEITFPLLESPTWIMHRLCKACKHLNQETMNHESGNYKVLEVLPSNVVSFLCGDNPLQRQLPMTLSKSRIHDEKRLKGLIAYCKKGTQSNFNENLHRLPLLFTQDGNLRRLSRDERVFASEFCDLFIPQSHRFLHINFLHTLPRNTNVFCELDVRAVSALLDDCHPYLECASDEIITLQNQLSSEWFERLWSLLESLCTETNTLTDVAHDIRAELGRWAILPVTETKTQYPQEIKLVAPISLSSTIIVQPTESEKRWWPIYSALESLNVYKVEKCILREDKNSLIHHLVTHKGDSTRVLDALMYWVDRDVKRFRNLEADQHEEILRFLSNCGSQADLKRLKSLPCFKSIAGDFVSIRGFDTVLVLPSMIPKKEQDKWTSTTRAIFLQYNTSLQSLYKKLELTDTTEIDVYVQYILPVFDQLSEDSRLEHLVRIKKLLLPLPIDNTDRSFSETREEAIRRLRLSHLLFITGENGELLKAEDFYDPQVQLFSLMWNEVRFPPDRVKNSLGLPFLREIGLQVVITRELFLSFAQQVQKSHSDLEEMKEKSNALVFELGRTCDLHKDSSLLQEVSMVDFLVSDGISQEMESIHPPFMKKGTLMRYSGSSSFEHTQLVWSTISVLPKYAALEKCYSCNKTFDEKMGVAQEPEFMIVIQHLRNICNRLQKKNDRKISSPEDLAGVLQEILTFVSSKCARQNCSEEDPCERCCIIRDELRNVPVVLLELEDEHRLVIAEQISCTADENLEPFLYQLPNKWVPFLKVFQILGGTVKPSIRQYAFVLESLYRRGPSAWSNPNVDIVDRATFGLYEELIKTDPEQIAAAFVPGHSLYLPSCQQRLERSESLLVNDVDHYTNRLLRSNQPLVKIFPSHERIAQEAIARLPERMKPKAVSTEVNEMLSKTGNDSRKCYLTGNEPCGFGRRLQILQSKEFLEAVCSIMRHNRRAVDGETRKQFRDLLTSLKITCIQQLHSILQINGQDIEGSETKVPSFVNSDNELFVQHSEVGNRMVTLVSVAIHVNKVLGNLFEDRNYMSILLSQDSSATIPEALAMFGIAFMEDDTNLKLPNPGSTIPEQLYHLMEQNPWTSFSTGDYVGYAQTYEDGDYYIYAVVVKRICNESLKSVYLIDIGKDSPIEANVLDMHKIHIPNYTSCMEPVLSDQVNSVGAGPCFSGHRESSLLTDVEEANRQVTAELEEIWQLPAELTKKALPRLMLKWHSDKHPEGPKELFDKAFEHIKSELENSSYEDLPKLAEQRAREDQQRYNQGEVARRFPNIPKALLWLRQGQEDLRAAQHDLKPHDEPSLEWVAYKCHQSVEKALKAAQLAIRGCHSNTHSIDGLARDVSEHASEHVREHVQSSEFLQNICQLSSLVGDQQARYPDSCASSQIPHEVFIDQTKGEEMIQLARNILAVVESSLVPSKS
ncbi:sacsin-like [Strongylocentrotus purpuratus]|uniref:HEPN domain-containing protein n=1 Tax=Strongylocentrotus purpuratus TaxID=7668 RepID=A0A7M7NUB1_STRPU|nr:sacsin-like [Strongylocentrotus purpuratus]